MLTVKSREHGGQEILINPDNIQYITPSISGETVVYFSGTNFLVLSESFEEFKTRFEQKTVMELLGIPDSPTNTADLYKDLDQYPAHLPRLPTGYVDKRTTLYKEYIASL